jgi:hypothetical protein
MKVSIHQLTNDPPLSGNEEKYRPTCFLETNYWKVWDSKPDVVTRHGDYEFKWTIETEKKPVSHDTYTHYNYVIISERMKPAEKPAYPYLGNIQRYMLFYAITTWVKKFDDENWIDDTVTPSQKWKSHNNISDSFKDLCKSLKEVQKERSRTLSAARKEKYKTQAEKEGITIEEIKDRNKKALLEKMNLKAKAANLEKTKTMVLVGPALKTLQDQIDFILTNASKNPDVIEPRNTSNMKRKIMELTRELEKWNKSK